MDNSTLKALLRRISEGDNEAFETLYNEMKRPVYTVMLRTTRNRELAADLTQDLFLKLYRAPISPDVSSPRAWIWQMARNLAIDALRKEHPASPLPEEDDCPGASDDITSLQKRLDLNSAFALLDPLARQIVTLHIDAELTFMQIAALTSLSLPKVYRIYKKAISELQATLNGGNL